MHKNKVFCAKFSPLAVNLVYSGGWDRQIKFWDVRSDSLVNQINGIQICGDSVDMSQNNIQVVTGGGSLGEGIHLWDMRKTDKPTKALSWAGETGASQVVGEEQKHDPYFVNPTINVVKFAPIAGTTGLDTDYIIAGCRDKLHNANAKCIATRTGVIVNEFKHV